MELGIPWCSHEDVAASQLIRVHRDLERRLAVVVQNQS